MEVKALAEAPATHLRAVDPDAELVAAACEEPRAFLALYDRYFERVLGGRKVLIMLDELAQYATRLEAARFYSLLQTGLEEALA